MRTKWLYAYLIISLNPTHLPLTGWKLVKYSKSTMPYESYKTKKEEWSSKRLTYLHTETSTVYHRNAIIMTRKAIITNITTNAISYTDYKVAIIINLYYDLYYFGAKAKRIPNAVLFITTKIILRETTNSII